MPLTTAVRGHGTFIYRVSETIADYGSVKATAEAIVALGMSHAWIRIHGQTAMADPKPTAQLIDAMRVAGISVAGWGWCQGADVKAEGKLAAAQLKRFGLTDYVADIEEGVNNARWTPEEVKVLLSGLREHLDGALVVSTFGLIDWHSPELMTAADPLVDAFAPQVYWFTFPNKKMVKEFRRPDGGSYPQNDAQAYATLCLDRWAKVATRPLIVTGQAYWGEGIAQPAAQDKLDQFLAGFQEWERLVGFNWWHFGGGRAMSHHMFESIRGAAIGNKTFAAG